jgi:hypothetical protein
MQGEDGEAVSLTDDQWHMVTFVDNAGVKSIYVDGVPVTMTMTAFNNADTANADASRLQHQYRLQ